MHDPRAVAFDIPRPWPRRSGHPNPGSPGRRWAFRYSWAKWYDLRPRVFMKFSTVAGHELYWPSFITVWHNEPGGHDFGEVCRTRKQGANGRWHFTRGWQWHVHHWSIQVHPLQRLRRRLLTRCEWCGGRSTKTDVVNHSDSWDRDRGKWWEGERGLRHHDCSTIAQAHRTCTCGVGPWSSGDYGKCLQCGRFRVWRKTRTPGADDPTRILQSIPVGQRDPAKYAQAVALWQQREVGA